jgi:hypothetical protein
MRWMANGVAGVLNATNGVGRRLLDENEAP